MHKFILHYFAEVIEERWVNKWIKQSF
jgi:hypothetical protein